MFFNNNNFIEDSEFSELSDPRQDRNHQDHHHQEFIELQTMKMFND